MTLLTASVSVSSNTVVTSDLQFDLIVSVRNCGAANPLDVVAARIVMTVTALFMVSSVPTQVVSTQHQYLYDLLRFSQASQADMLHLQSPAVENRNPITAAVST